jgi:hypothetical protein
VFIVVVVNVDLLLVRRDGGIRLFFGKRCVMGSSRVMVVEVAELL